MFRWHEFRPDEKGIEKVLGPLESRIMEIMWNEEISVARDIYDIMKEKDKNTRRSTISIMMNRLCERGLLERHAETGRGGERFVYTVRISKEEFSQAIVSRVMKGLLDSFEDSTLKYVRNHLSGKT
ncbi:MAG: BlaI/MecI/CopY family transcriptional regulator [Theionarchaea archaeon]|nr:BlaI/MecI/CopY family transcriptional regulator [Theionarchaea archaeon]